MVSVFDISSLADDILNNLNNELTVIPKFYAQNDITQENVKYTFDENDCDTESLKKIFSKKHTYIKYVNTRKYKLCGKYYVMSLTCLITDKQTDKSQLITISSYNINDHVSKLNNATNTSSVFRFLFSQHLLFKKTSTVPFSLFNFDTQLETILSIEDVHSDIHDFLKKLHEQHLFSNMVSIQGFTLKHINEGIKDVSYLQEFLMDNKDNNITKQLLQQLLGIIVFLRNTYKNINYKFLRLNNFIVVKHNTPVDVVVTLDDDKFNIKTKYQLLFYDFSNISVSDIHKHNEITNESTSSLKESHVNDLNIIIDLLKKHQDSMGDIVKKFVKLFYNKGKMGRDILTESDLLALTTTTVEQSGGGRKKKKPVRVSSESESVSHVELPISMTDSDSDSDSELFLQSSTSSEQPVRKYKSKSKSKKSKRYQLSSTTESVGGGRRSRHNILDEMSSVDTEDIFANRRNVSQPTRQVAQNAPFAGLPNGSLAELEAQGHNINQILAQQQQAVMPPGPIAGLPVLGSNIMPPHPMPQNGFMQGMPNNIPGAVSGPAPFGQAFNLPNQPIQPHTVSATGLNGANPYSPTLPQAGVQQVAQTNGIADLQQLMMANGLSMTGGSLEPNPKYRGKSLW